MNCRTGIFWKRAIFGICPYLDFRKSLIFGIRRCWILTNSNKSKFSINANAHVLSTSTQYPQWNCRPTIIMSAKTYYLTRLRAGCFPNGSRARGWGGRFDSHSLTFFSRSPILMFFLYFFKIIVRPIWRHLWRQKW